MAFEGFSKDTLKFLGQLQKNNNRDWFQENKSRFDEGWMAPAKEFVMSIGKHLYTISPEINAEPRVNASIRRINRDIRFSKNKTPYKDHFDFFFRYAEASKDGPGYFVRIQQKKLAIGGGVEDQNDGLIELDSRDVSLLDKHHRFHLGKVGDADHRLPLPTGSS